MAQEKGFWGNKAGPGPSYYNSYIEFRVSEYGDNSCYVQYKYSIDVDTGDFYGTSVRRSWGGNVNLYGSGWYGDSGWCNYGWVGYGSAASASCSVSYTSGSGAYHESICNADYYPEPPVWTPYTVSNVTCAQKGLTNVIRWTRDVAAARPYNGISLERSTDRADWQILEYLSGSVTSYTDSVRPNHTYVYRMSPYNSAGSAPYAYTDAVTSAPAKPSSPVSIIAARINDNKNTVTWTGAPTQEAPYQKIVIERSVNDGGWTQINTVSGSVGSYTDTSTSANNFYRYRVRAYNISGYSSYSAPSAYVYNTPSAPDKPIGRRASETSVVLNFSNSARTASATEIQRASSAQDWATIATTDGKATQYTDNPGGGSWYYRVRNKRGDLVSSWSPQSDAVVTICPPAAPTISKPVSGVVIPKTNPMVVVEWIHNALDGSRQSAAQVQYSVNGADWITVDVAGTNSVTLQNNFPVNATLTIRVRTKGAHKDWSAWSGNRTCSIRLAPDVSFDEPSSGFIVKDVPIAVKISYIDQSGNLASATFEVRDATGTVLYRRDITKLDFTVEYEAFAPTDGQTYKLVAVCRSSTGLQTTAERFISVEFAAPKRTSLRIDTDADTGYITLQCVVNQNDDGATVDHSNVYRIADNKTVMVAEDIADGSTFIDKYAPSNRDITYRVVTFAKSGATGYTEHIGRIKTPYAFFLWGDNNIARAAYNPEQTIRLARPNKVHQYYANRKHPVSYDSGNMSHERSFSGAIRRTLEAEMFMQLMNDGGTCVYKSIDGHVYHADVEVSLSPYLTLPNNYGTVSVDITQIDGDDL